MAPHAAVSLGTLQHLINDRVINGYTKGRDLPAPVIARHFLFENLFGRGAVKSGQPANHTWRHPFEQGLAITIDNNIEQRII